MTDASDEFDDAPDGKPGEYGHEPEGYDHDQNQDHDHDSGDGPGADTDRAERRRLLRETAEELRGDSSESQQLAAILYRVSDLYDPDEETTPEEIYRAVRFIMQVKERGGRGG